MKRHTLFVGSAVAVAVAAAFVAAAGSMPSAAPAGPNDHRIGGFRARNVIIMISDGWGYNHVLATNYHQHGKARRQVYEHFPVRLGMSTFSLGNYDVSGAYGAAGSYDPAQAWSGFDYVKSGATDSASAATAMSTGVKTYDAAIGVDGRQQPLVHLMDLAERAGKATGVVSTVQISHATPAGFVAHNISRNDYAGIAKEMIERAATDVIIGAGHPFFDDNGNSVTTAISYKYVGGEETWGDVTEGRAGSDANRDGVNDPWQFVETRHDFQRLAAGRAPNRLLGVFQAHTTTQQARSGDGMADPHVVARNPYVPTLAEISRAALNVLDNDRDGFVLMIEGGAVDWAGHANQSGRVIEEQEDFNEAVDAVVGYLIRTRQFDDTLLIVTGDHETGYLTGPDSGTGSDGTPMWTPLINNGRGVLPGMQWNSGNHTNSLIPFYAIGRASLLFRAFVDGKDSVRGPYLDNTAIPAVARIALGLPPH